MRHRLMIRLPRGLLFLALVASVGSVFSRRVAQASGPWYVAPTGQNTNDCLSPATACKTIGGAIEKAASGDTINIAAGTYHEILVIPEKNLNLIGAGATSTIIDAKGAPPQQGVTGVVLATNAVVRLSGATLRNGAQGVYVGPGSVVSLTNVNISGNAPGGGIFNDGLLTVTNATVSGNHASEDGGGLLNYLHDGKATLTNVTISGNTARYRGGGIMNSAALTLTNVIIASNVVTDGTDILRPAGGGGVFNEGTLVFVNGAMSNNAAPSEGGEGGALANLGAATLSRITINGNSGSDGGGVLNDLFGGTATLTMTNVTISGNAASLAPGGVGGGISNGGAAASLTNVTISGNAANRGGGIYTLRTTRIKNSIIANSLSGGNCSVDQHSLVSLGHNLDSGSTCVLTGTGDLQNTNPLLGPLVSNGGFSPTHALLPGSPAIDTGDNVGCPNIDQRGAIRPTDGDANHSAICDIGAYERAASDSLFFLPLLRK
jgi:hypothetical protein